MSCTSANGNKSRLILSQRTRHKSCSRLPYVQSCAADSRLGNWWACLPEKSNSKHASVQQVYEYIQLDTLCMIPCRTSLTLCKLCITKLAVLINIMSAADSLPMRLGKILQWVVYGSCHSLRTAFCLSFFTKYLSQF